MPVISCPKCAAKIRVAEDAAGNVRCPKCANAFPIIAPKPTAAFEVVDEPPASPPPRPVAPKSAAKPKAAAPAPVPPPPPPAENPFTLDDDKPKPKKKSLFDDLDTGKREAKPRDEDEDDEVDERPKSKPRREAVDEDEDDKPKPKKKSLFDDLGDDDKPRAKRRRDDDDDDDDDDRPRSKRRRDDDDDDDDDRPRKKRRRDDDDDDDDRPRGKRRRYTDDDDDDDDDRPRKKRRRDDDDDDDDDDWHRSPKKKGKGASGFAPAKTGMLLLNISFWLYMSSVGLIALGIFLGWVGAFDRSSSSTRTTTSTRGGYTQYEESSSNSTGEMLVKLPGLLGIGNWIVAGVGFGFCIAGPKQARGMAITAASLAGAHLVLAGISISNVGAMLGGYGGMGSNSGLWLFWATTLPILDSLLPVVIMGGSRYIGSDYIFALLAAGCELARLIFTMLMVRRLAEVTKDHESAERAQFGVVGAAALTGATAALALVLALLAKADAIKGFNILIGSALLIYLAFTAMSIMPIIATNGVRKSLARRAR